MIKFIFSIGCFVGFIVGVVVTPLACAGKKGDRHD